MHNRNYNFTSNTWTEPLSIHYLQDSNLKKTFLIGIKSWQTIHLSSRSRTLYIIYILCVYVCVINGSYLSFIGKCNTEYSCNNICLVRYWWDVWLDFVRQIKSKKFCLTPLKSWDVRLGFSSTNSSNKIEIQIKFD